MITSSFFMSDLMVNHNPFIDHIINKVYYCDISALPNGLESQKGKELLPFVKLIDKFEAICHDIANDDVVFTFRTNKDAPKYKLVRVDLKEPSTWTEVLQETEKDVLESAIAVNGDQMVMSNLSDVKHVLQKRNLERGALLHHLPIEIGSVYDVFVPSKDGTKIPMFIVAKKDIVLDGSHPCLLYAYGGFNISLSPTFSVCRIVLARHLGAVYCIANICGGGEYGEEWHKAGSLAKKQNCFDDFISAAEYLVSAGDT
ncbi:hypothetical protein RJ640_023557 [Escallonia rubra]|uniref:Prolyl endopeptidase n=1 Tax=Escallonia rubra TaxID=112253 RepID=A0AA88RI91_9ASTE|nr:hypothetical protein RJ640_023557 [Escallonia rubra]